jgi:hypothetical protein
MPRLWLAAILVVLPAPLAPAPQDGALQLNADFVWGRQYRPEGLNPVVITIDNPGSEIRGVLQLRWSWHPSPMVSAGAGPEGLEGGAGPIHELAVVIPENSRRRYFVAVEGQQGPRGGLWVFLSGSGRAPKPFGIAATAIPPEDVAVAQIGSGDAPGFARAGARILIARPEELPDRWHGYAPIDVALWLEGDAAAAVDTAQIEALKRWVACGGHLIRARASAVGFAGTFLEELAGVRIKETRPHSDWKALAEWAGVPEPPQGEAAILEVSTHGAAVLARAGDRPLAVRRHHARGRVTFLAFDPSSDAFRAWSGAEKFWKVVAELPDAREDPSNNLRDRGPRGGRRANAPTQTFSRQEAWGPERSLGSAILASHLMSQPGVPIPPIGAGLLLLVIYAALIGPVDYLVLRRLKRQERTWITFPATAVAFALVLVAVGLSMKRQAASVRDVLIEDHIAEADLVRGWSLTTVTLPDRDVISAKVRSRESTLRALDRQAGRPGRIMEGRVEDWEFDYGSVGLAVGEWCEPGSRLRVERAGPDRIRVVNGTGAALRDATYASGGRLWTTGRIPEGESMHDLGSWAPGAGLSARDYGADSRQFQGFQPWRRPSTEEEWAAQARELVRDLSLAPPDEGNRDRRGTAASLDLRAWLADGGGVLQGWCDGAPVIELSRGSGQRRVLRLVRAFTRHD